MIIFCMKGLLLNLYKSNKSSFLFMFYLVLTLNPNFWYRNMDGFVGEQCSVTSLPVQVCPRKQLFLIRLESYLHAHQILNDLEIKL